MSVSTARAGRLSGLVILVLAGAGLVAGTCLAPTGVAAGRPQAWTIDRLDQVSGIVRAVDLEDHTAYVGFGQRLEVYDVTEPRAPRRIGRSDLLPAPPDAFGFVGGHVLVAAGSVVVVDVTDPTSPRIVWNVDAVRGAKALAITGERAYVLDATGLAVLGVSNPARPSVLGRWRGDGDAVAADGDIAYVVGTAGVRVIDARDPARPTQVSLLTEPGAWGPYAAATSAGYLWVADTLEIRIVDVRDAQHPRFVTRIATPETLERSGEPIADIMIDGNRVVHAGRTDLRLYDAASPAAPTLLGHLSVRGNVASVSAKDGVGLLADRDAGLRTVDLTNVASPQLAALVHSRSAGGAAIVGTRIYAFAGEQEAYGDSLWAVDIGEGGVLTTKGQIGLPTTRDVAVVGRYVYAACGESGLEVIDFGNVLQPYGLATYQPPGRAVRTLAVSGTRLFVGDPFSGLTVVDASRPSSLTALGTVALPGPPADLAVAGRYVFAAQGAVGMTIVDVSNGAAPTVVGRFNPGEGPDGVGLWDVRAVAVDGAIAWMVTSDGSLVAANVSSPSSPRQIAAHRLDGDPTGLAVLGPGKLVVTTNAFGFPPGLVRLYDVSDPASPAVLARLETPGVAGAVATDGAIIVVADGEAGVLALGVREVAEPTEPPTELPTETPTVTPSPTPVASATTPSGQASTVYLPVAWGG
jgi:hypothetical protein